MPINGIAIPEGTVTLLFFVEELFRHLHETGKLFGDDFLKSVNGDCAISDFGQTFLSSHGGRLPKKSGLFKWYDQKTRIQAFLETLEVDI
jgi:hypothetical protein